MYITCIREIKVIDVYFIQFNKIVWLIIKKDNLYM